jgi:predicted permease
VGRTIASPDDHIEAPPVAMISHAYWLKRFGGDVTIVGKSISVNATPVTIIGVTPPGFLGAKAFGRAPALFLPLAFVDRFNPGSANIASQPGFRWLFGVIGRLKPGVTGTRATANFAELFRHSVLDGSAAATGHDVDRTKIRADFPQLTLEQGNNGSDQIRRESGRKLIILAALMGLVLLIACTNVANLLLARSATRRREIAVRMALGAHRMRLVRQLLTESLLLAAIGGLLGVAMAGWGADLLAVMLRFGGVEKVELDWHVLGFAAVISLLTGLLFGLAPALRATELDLTAEFQGGVRIVAAGSTLRLGRWLMVVQLALSFIVLTGAGLFLLTLRNLRAADVGFAQDHLLLFRLDAAPAGYKSEQFASLFGRIIGEVRALPGVRAAAYSSVPVVGGLAEFYGVRIPRNPITDGDRPPAAAVNEVGGDFFAVYNLPPVFGRTLDTRDEAKTAMVAVVNQAMADKFFPGENPVGHHFTAGRGEREIVGVVRNINYRDAREPAPPTVYSPFVQAPSGSANFVVRTAIAPGMLVSAVRQVVRAIDPKLPVDNVRTQDEQMERLFAEERIFARLSSVLGGLALALVCVGLCGLMSYATLRRTNEIGVRMALGAQPGRIFKMILSESLTLVLAGVIMGIAGAYGTTRLISGMLYGLAATDPMVYGGVALVLAAVALLACLLPARHAAKVDPVTAMRAE